MPPMELVTVLAPVVPLGCAAATTPMPRTLGYRKALVGVHLGTGLSSGCWSGVSRDAEMGRFKLKTAASLSC